MPIAPLSMHPAAHVLHYASTCFEGFKAYRWADGSIHVFRMDRHIERMRQSARLLSLAGARRCATRDAWSLQTIDRARAQVPEPPGALYLRPVLFGTHAQHRRGLAAVERGHADRAREPVWDYFAGGMKPLRIYVEDQRHRTAEHLGMVKTGGNYAAAMGPTLAAKEKYRIDQVLFCPGGSVQETGAANFLLIRDRPHPDAQPRLDVPARRDARLVAEHGAPAGLQGRGTRVRRRRDARVGQDR